ncbi:MAG: DUF4258 domain-containing protein [Planctomycetes bacterium]|nr:DUF4258 domain-containing protein [Planctomycetota bacterium]
MALTIEELRAALAAGRYQLSTHALRRVIERKLTAEMIRAAGDGAEVIEDYPDDKYCPSCLLLGFTPDGVPLHV